MLNNLLLAGLGAVLVEVLRVRAALQAERDDDGAKLFRFPRYYFVTQPLLVVLSAGLVLAFPESTNSFLCLYIGASAPKVFATILMVCEPLLPGAIDPEAVAVRRRSDDERTIDDLGSGETRSLVHIRRNRFRVAGGIYQFLTLP